MNLTIRFQVLLLTTLVAGLPRRSQDAKSVIPAYRIAVSRPQDVPNIAHRNYP